jgi:hypothetical protein
MPLKAEISRDGLLMITVSADIVKWATEHHPEYWDADTDTYSIKVANKREWLRSVVRAINHEAEDGSTMLSDMMDKAIELAAEGGEEGLEYDDK